MKTYSIICLTTLIFTASMAEPAEAGRRARRRRAAVAVGVGVGVGAGVAAATVRRRPVVAAAAPVASPVVAAPAPVVLLPDLTVTDIAVTDTGHCITVQNIGQAASPLTHMHIEFRRLADDALLATKLVRVRPLLVNQTIRFRLHAIPPGDVQAIVYVDPDNQVAESNEENNDRTADFITQQPELLEDVDVWFEPQQSQTPAPLDSENNSVN